MRFDLISIGCLSLDTIFEVPALPRVNSECFVRRTYNAHGGGAANVAAYSSFFGGLQVGLVSKIGTDDEGEELVTRMKQYSVCVRGVGKVENSMSTRIAIIHDFEGNRVYLVTLGAVEELSSKDLPAGYVSDSTLFYIGPCTPRVHKEFVEVATKHRKLIAFNPGSVYFQEGHGSNFHQLLEFVDVLFVNEQEAFQYSNEESVQAAGLALQKLGAKSVIITRGDFGCTVFHQSESESFPGYKVKRVCPVGAGDAFAAGFLAEFKKSGNVESAAKSGNAFAAFAITHSTIRHAAPSKDQFRQFLQELR